MDNIDSHIQSVRDSYDAIASAYADHNINELKPDIFDVHMLNHFAQLVHAQGTVCDLGCGPGQVAAYLHERGIPVIGIDLSPAMIEQARKLHPAISFQQGDMRALPFSDGELAGIVAFYSIIHTPREEVVAVLDELHRVMQRNGYLLLSFYLGRIDDHRSEWFHKAVSLDFILFRLDEMKRYLREAGFQSQIVVEHGRTHEIEAPHGFILARKMRKR